jgi:hypothetical protein
MESLEYIKDRFQVDLEQKSPIKLPVDRFRGLTSIFRELGFKVGAEIGVASGRYSKWLVMRAKPEKLFLVDPYTAYPEYVEQHDEKGQAELDQAYKNAQERLAKFNSCEFVLKPSMVAVDDFNDNSLDFVFIDGNHTFEYAVNDIAEWSKKVKPGGIVSGHDYWRSFDSQKRAYVELKTPLEKLKLVQVKDAVNGWTRANQIKPWFLIDGFTWFWVKE